jgi:hypothetical protein
LRRIERSSIAPVTRPTGAARFWSCNACATCATLTPDACSLLGTSSTVSSRTTLPLTATSATPGIERSSRVIVGSARRVSSACESTVLVSARETIGRSVSLNFWMIGSFISTGRSARFADTASRRSCVAPIRSLPNWNSTMIRP